MMGRHLTAELVHIAPLEREGMMRRIVILLALVGAGVLIARKFRVHERLMARCEAMFERLPHSAPGEPPKLHERVMKQCEAMFQQTRATSTAEKTSDALQQRGVATAG